MLRRVRKPHDKAKVEVAVLVVERWILARLEKPPLFLLAELDQAIAELVAVCHQLGEFAVVQCCSQPQNQVGEAILGTRCKASACMAFCFETSNTCHPAKMMPPFKNSERLNSAKFSHGG